MALGPHPLWSPLRGPRFPRSAGDSEPGRSHVPHKLNFLPHPNGAGGDCGLREALRLRAETQPGTRPCAAPLPAGQDPASVGCSESEAAWLPGSVLRGCSPPRPRLLRHPGRIVRSPSRRSHSLCLSPSLSRLNVTTTRTSAALKVQQELTELDRLGLHAFLRLSFLLLGTEAR